MEARPQEPPVTVAPSPADAELKATPRPDQRSEEELRRAAAVEAFAQGRDELSDENERDALDWLLAGTPPVEYGVPFDWETPEGTKKATWIILSHDGRKLDAIEQRNVSETTGQLDVITANCQLLAEASIGIEGRPGHVLALDDEKFRTVMVRKEGEAEPVPHTFPSAADAIEARFRRQMGLVAGVAAQVRRISGYDPARVGQAQRRGAAQQRRASLAVGNS
jgi:hypothetical protein